MAYDEKIAQRIRNQIKNLDDVREKKMFGGLAFMVNGKMSFAVGSDDVMFRIDPKIHEQEVKKAGCSTTTMGGKSYKGYIDVEKESLQKESELKYWIGLALDFNEQIMITDYKKTD